MDSDQSQPENRPKSIGRARYSRRRQFVTLGASVGAALLAGCTEEIDLSDSGDSGADGESNHSDNSSANSATFRLLISDRPADIGDFERLDVSFDSARVFPDREEDSPEKTDEETSEPDDDEQQRGFYILDLDGATVDLVQVVGDRAVPVFEGELSEGTYEKIELHVSEVEGIVDGERAEVDVPSEKLQITTPFEIRADASVDFVFDINVVKRGQENRYNLTPVISESGVAGEDVEVEEVDAGRGDDESEETADTSNDSETGDGGEDAADDDGDAEQVITELALFSV